MRFDVLWRWLRNRSVPQTSTRRVVMYTRRGCHLCEIAWANLEKARQRYPFSLSAIDVDEDAVLLARYGDEVPVILIDDKVRFRGGFNPVLLTRLLEAELGAQLRRAQS